jgi:hypothetical protein
MIRLTVLYNLPPGVDEAEFLRWRTGPHQKSNEGMSGVMTTDFGRIDQQWIPAGIQDDAPYRFMTIMDFPDRETFEHSFLAQNVQDKLSEDLKRIHNPLFLISEILISSQTEA